MLISEIDYLGVKVLLSEEVWFDKILNPIFGHPEVKPYLKKIKQTISNPDHVYKSVRDARSKLLFLKLKSGLFVNYWLLVVVKYVKENNKTVGYISTVFITDKLPKKGQIII